MDPEIASRPIFLFTHPRTASNLLMKMLRDHPGLGIIEYPFVDTYYYGKESLTLRDNDRMRSAKKRLHDHPALCQTFQAAFDQLEQTIQSTHATGRIPFIKEHAFTLVRPEVISQNLGRDIPPRTTPRVIARALPTAADQAALDGNPTVLPTQFLLGVTPVFLIRHPALVFESILRVSGPTMGARVDDEEFLVDASLRWLRLLHDWFARGGASANGGVRRPIVLNADEVMARPTVVQKLCERLRVDPGDVCFQWDPVAPSVLEAQGSYHQHFFSTIQTSSGVQLDKHSAPDGRPLDLDAMAESWQEAHGSDAAAALRSFVAAAMPDYEYLSQFELQLES
ncbi:hypothetical protein SAMD00023353_4301100 [Rosellinia necatrix]|uniref:Sulfotransferase family protein n=1 Tax=Rosellinia necatrix TaxID=77044 RepID=A0A1S8A9E0_ROSNE|nr:hypothetical protein SAMD00023353_4301100 [Rosellinia necatrix]